MKKILLLIWRILFFVSIPISIFAINGPTSKPNIIGPIKGPPTKTEINQLKCTKDPDFIGSDFCKKIKFKTEKKTKTKKNIIGFWKWLWNLILTIF